MRGREKGQLEKSGEPEPSGISSTWGGRWDLSLVIIWEQEKWRTHGEQAVGAGLGSRRGEERLGVPFEEPGQ